MRSFALVQNSEPLQEIIYCMAKRGEYEFDKYNRTRLIAETKTFEELRLLLAIIVYSTDDQPMIEDEFFEAVRFCDADNEVPKLDRLRRWPWDAEYEGADHE